MTAAQQRGARKGGMEASNASTAATLGFTGLVVAVVFMVGLHVLAPPHVSPIRSVMSDYVLANGVGWMFGASVAGIAVSSLGAVIGLTAAGLARVPIVRFGLWLTVFSALITAVFPTDEELPLSLTAEIHRYGAITLFVCLPIIGMLIAGQLAGLPEVAVPRLWLLGTSVVAAVVLTVFLLAHLDAMPQGLQDLRGLLQRQMMVLEVAILAQLLVIPRRLSEQIPARQTHS